MLPTFVIGLREGLEASLVVGIVAAFLVRRGRGDLLRWVYAGVAAAVALCTAVGFGLQTLSRSLPQRQQEGLETVIGLVAVAMVTYMVVWMRRHSRGLKGQLEGAATQALAAGSGFALVMMAFLAVLREGFETAVFLLAAFNENSSGAPAWLGAVLGLLVAGNLGYALYRGGVRLNLSRFFRATGVVLVLVAAGLLMNAAHTAHEAGWLNWGQDEAADLGGVVRPGSIQASLLTGVLGIQPRPTVVEVIAWSAYLLPIGFCVGWPPGRRVRVARLQRPAAVCALGFAALALTLVLVAPDRRAPAESHLAGHELTLRGLTGQQATVTVDGTTLTFTRTGSARIAGVATASYAAVHTATTPGGITRTLGELAAANGGRLPLGAAPAGADFSASVPVRATTVTTTTIQVAPKARLVLDLRTSERRSLLAQLAAGAVTIPVGDEVRAGTSQQDIAATARRARGALADQRHHRRALTGAAIAALCAAVAASFWLRGRARGPRETQ